MPPKKKAASKKSVATASGIPVYCAHKCIADITDVKPNPRNPNRHSDAQIGLLAKIIRNQGWRAPITISARSGLVVRGHGRLEAAKLLGVTEVPVDAQYYKTEAEEYADLVADNQIAEMSSVDREALKDMIESLDVSDFDLTLTGINQKELENLMTAAPPPDADNKDPEPPPSSKTAIICPKCGHKFDMVMDSKLGDASRN